MEHARADEADFEHARLAWSKYLGMGIGDYVASEDDEEDDKDRARNACMACDPIASANQFAFALDLSGRDMLPRAQFTPIADLRAGRDVDTSFLPLDHLLPPGSKESLFGHDWDIPGPEAPIQLASLLLSLGFAWNEPFQALIDARAHADGASTMRPLIQARREERELHAELARPSPSQRQPRI